MHTHTQTHTHTTHTHTHTHKHTHVSIHLISIIPASSVWIVMLLECGPPYMVTADTEQS